ncbi:MAG: PAS domain-containing protein, partial [Calditrichaeota bacterium]
LFPESERQRVQNLLKRAASRGLDIDDSLSVRTRAGECIPVETQVSLIAFEGEAHLFCNVREIGERRRLQTLILNSKRRLQSTFDGIRDFIYQVDKDYEIVIANKAFATACGTKPEDLVGKKCFEVCYQRAVPCEVCPVAKPFSTLEPDAVEKYHNDDIVELFGYPILDEQGGVDSVVVYGRNVTEKRMLEKSLIQSEKLATIGLLASGIAHEIRNPLNIIETARYYIEEFAEEPGPDIRAKLEIIRKNVKRASKIINNLLEFSRQSEHEREKIDLCHLISNTISLIGKELEAKNIEFSLTSEKECFAYFSVDSLKQVVLNLIINAIQAMPGGGKLNIEIRNTGADTIDLRIADTGVGIPEEHLQQIFAPFFTTKGANEGTGLGLYISKMIIEREGGAIKVESRVKRGTAFTLTLPRTAPESETHDRT